MERLRTTIVIAAIVAGWVVPATALASYHPDFPPAPSEVAWMRSNDKSTDHWTKGSGISFWSHTDNAGTRGWHPDYGANASAYPCQMCHNGYPGIPAGGNPTAYPQETQPAGSCGGRVCHVDQIVKFEDVNWSSWPRQVKNTSLYPCGTACHHWLKDIDEPGFTNALPQLAGQPGYKGPIDPLYLLSQGFDVNGNGRDHKAIYENFGCRGFCHNPAMTLEQAQAWAKDGTMPNVTKGLVHGYINTCTNCHEFSTPLGGPDDLHTTHASLIQVEKLSADVNGKAVDACSYCHGKPLVPAIPGQAASTPGGCYNCHLSGHRPETYYWKALPPLPSLPLPPL